VNAAILLSALAFSAGDCAAPCGNACNSCNSCCDHGCLRDRIHGWFHRHDCCNSCPTVSCCPTTCCRPVCCQQQCQPVCRQQCCPQPCCRPVNCCPQPCCKPVTCCPQACCRPVCQQQCCQPVCRPVCCHSGCNSGCNNGCGCGHSCFRDRCRHFADRCHSFFHRNNCCDNCCFTTTCGSTVAPNAPAGEKIAPPKTMPKGEKTEVRILTPSGTVPTVTPNLEVAPAAIVPSAGAEIRSPF
jgi:hypothetical protein